MSEPFIAEIIMFGGNFPPRGWAFCDGQLLAISSNTALFSLLGTTFGGDGRTTFGLPELRGRAPMHPGTGPGLTPRTLGEKGGTETETLTLSQLASHAHVGGGRCRDETANAKTPVGNVPAIEAADLTVIYVDDSSPGGQMAAGTTNTGGGQAHNNVQPFQGIYFIIALVGIFPSRN